MVNTKKNNALLFIENLDHIAFALKFLKRHYREGLSIRVIALSPTAAYLWNQACPENSANIPDDFCSKDDINSVGMQSFSLVEQFCEFSDKFISEGISVFNQYNIAPFFSHFRFFKILFDALIIRIFEIIKII